MVKELGRSLKARVASSSEETANVIGGIGDMTHGAMPRAFFGWDRMSDEYIFQFTTLPHFYFYIPSALLKPPLFLFATQLSLPLQY